MEAQEVEDKVFEALDNRGEFEDIFRLNEVCVTRNFGLVLQHEGEEFQITIVKSRCKPPIGG